MTGPRHRLSMGVREFYGGDLKGVMDKLDYLQDLGVEVRISESDLCIAE